MQAACLLQPVCRNTGAGEPEEWTRAAPSGPERRRGGRVAEGADSLYVERVHAPSGCPSASGAHTRPSASASASLCRRAGLRTALDLCLCFGQNLHHLHTTAPFCTGPGSGLLPGPEEVRSGRHRQLDRRDRGFLSGKYRLWQTVREQTALPARMRWSLLCPAFPDCSCVRWGRLSRIMVPGRPFAAACRKSARTPESQGCPAFAHTSGTSFHRMTGRFLQAVFLWPSSPAKVLPQVW